VSLADELSAPVWGQGFPPPRFRGDFRVDAQRVVGGRHLRFALTGFEPRARPVNAVLFGAAEPLPEAIHAVFRLDVDEYHGTRSLQLVLDHWQHAD
jgi:single-stranded-DNA-specific exonuclease